MAHRLLQWCAGLGILAHLVAGTHAVPGIFEKRVDGFQWMLGADVRAFK